MTLVPIVKTLVVPATPEAAFARFTNDVGAWWPLSTHTVFDGAAVGCAFEPRLGGRFFEWTADGREAEWGDVVAWEPPRRLVFTFMKYGGGPGTEVEVTFTEVATGTRVTLEHRGWEAIGQDTRERYVTGWDHALAPFARSF